MENIPKVGVGVIINKNGKFLFGKRKNHHGDGDWSLPGGHLEFKESWEECARREVKEETNIKIKNIRFATVTNDIFNKENKHYITIFVLADFESGEVKNMEPESCDCWDWFKWDQLPHPLFIPIKNLLKMKFNPLNN
jgi:8-oxo-dGTP diphosphatase